MPTYCPYLTSIDLEKTRHYAAGLKNTTAFNNQQLHEACLQAQLLSIPKGVWQSYAYDQDSHTILANEPVILTADTIIHQLTGAVEVAAVAITLGLPLEQEVSNLFSQQQTTLACLLDAAGTTALQAACAAVCKVISQQAAQAGLSAGRRISPGQGDWPLERQAKLLELAAGASIGLSVTDTQMLVPRKSVTALVGLYPYQQLLLLPSQQELLGDNCSSLSCQPRKEKCNND